MTSYKLNNGTAGWGATIRSLIDALQTALNNLETDGSGFAAGAIPNAALADVEYSAMDIDGTATDGYVITYNSSLDQLQWALNTPTGAGPVKMNALDSAEYVDAKLGVGLQNDGSNNITIDPSYLQYMGLI